MTTILAIETSCDDTSVAVVKDGQHILSNIVSSQIKSHQKFGGVVPELASRLHAEKINKCLDLALTEANCSFTDINAVAVTYGPGLEGCLLVGLTAAKTISMSLNIPLIGVNHLQGHIYASFLTETPPSFPFIGVIVSGGHTDLVLVKDHFEIVKIGATRDDAAGEAFDKVARALELGYPGGPVIEQRALLGNPKAFAFPRAMKHQGLEFSFSGLKTAVMQTILALKKEGKDLPIDDLCASFQQAVIDVLLSKSMEACKQYNCSTLVVSGGVTANQTLKKQWQTVCDSNQIHLYCAPPKLCTDNAAMIGAAGYYALTHQCFPELPLGVNANLNITCFR